LVPAHVNLINAGYTDRDRKHRQEIPMPDTKPHHNLEELSRLGAEVFDRQVRALLRPEDDGKFVAIDVASGDHEIDADDYAAVTRLRARRPSAEVWLGRVGQPAAYRMRRGR
jgi:hypothetical protein